MELSGAFHALNNCNAGLMLFYHASVAEKLKNHKASHKKKILLSMSCHIFTLDYAYMGRQVVSFLYKPATAQKPAR
jgi:hypothetical protein